MTKALAADDHVYPPRLSRSVILACATACGVMVGNLYFAQPLIALIGPDIGLGAAAGGLIVTLSMLGYAAGLLLIVPLADRLENRRLILTTIVFTVLALVALAAAPNAAAFLVAALGLGTCRLANRDVSTGNRRNSLR